MIDLEHGEIADLWRDNKEPEFQAISYAIKLEMARLKAKIDSSQIYAGVQNLQEDAVDELAIELCVKGYDQSMPLEVKRNAVASALLYYTYAGTVRAVRTLIQSLYGDAAVEEWFNYNGDPYHYRVSIDITHQLQTVPMLTREELTELLRGVTRTSAHLDDVSFMIRSGLLIGQRSAVYTINPVQCGVPYSGQYPEVKTQGYTADSGLALGIVLAGTDISPDPSGTKPYAAVSGWSEGLTLRSKVSQSPAGVDPIEVHVPLAGTYPRESRAGAFYAGGMTLGSMSVEKVVKTSEAGSLTVKGG